VQILCKIGNGSSCDKEQSNRLRVDMWIGKLLINQSINVKFVGRHYTTRPGAPTVVSGKHDQKVHS